MSFLYKKNFERLTKDVEGLGKDKLSKVLENPKPKFLEGRRRSRS